MYFFHRKKIIIFLINSGNRSSRTFGDEKKAKEKVKAILQECSINSIEANVVAMYDR